MTSKYLAELPKIELFEQNGYLTLKVSDKLLESINLIFRIGHDFYNQDKSTKEKNSIPDLHEGWQDVGGEFSIIPDRPDLSESFWVSLSNKDKTASAYSGKAFELRNEITRCIDMLNEVERLLTKQLRDHFGVDDSICHNFTCGHDCDLQVLYYQPSLQTRDLLQDPHDDSLYMTFSKSNNPGLEVLINGEYQGVKLEPNEIIVMPGEILALISGYRIRPLIHRVVRHHDQKERLSFGYFTFPDTLKGQKIDPWIINESNKDVDIADRIFHNKNKFFVE